MSDTQTIGYDAKRAFHNATGLGNYSRTLIERIAKTHPEIQLKLYTPRAEGVFYAFCRQFSNIHFHIPEGIWKTWKSGWRIFGIAKALQKDGIELYHGLSNELPIGISKSPVPSIVTIHDLIFKRYPHYYNHTDYRIYDRKSKYACEVASHIVATSVQTKEDIVRFYKVDPGLISVIYQDCNEQYHQPLDSELATSIITSFNLHGRYLLCVGTLESRKNQALLVDVLAQLDQDVQLVLVGRPGKYVKEIQQKIAQHALQSRVHFIQPKTNVELQALYMHAAMMAYPSQFEGFGIPLLEAMNCRTPILVCHRSCFPEICGDAAYYVSSFELDEWVSATKKLLSDTELRNDLIEKGIKRSKDFRGEKTLPQLIQLYQKIINQHG